MTDNDTQSGQATDNGGGQDCSSENRGGATRGPAGAIRRARNTAPDAAGEDLIEAVAMRAYRDDVDPVTVWKEVDIQ